jgi:hypothetical protein
MQKSMMNKIATVEIKSGSITGQYPGISKPEARGKNSIFVPHASRSGPTPAKRWHALWPTCCPPEPSGHTHPWQPGVVVYVCNPSTWEVEAGGSSLRIAWAT